MDAVGNEDWLHWVGAGKGSASVKKKSGSLIQCLCKDAICACDTSAVPAYKNNPTTFTYSDGMSGGKPATATKDSQGISVDKGTLGNVITIPHSSSDVVVRVYTGIYKNSPAVFNATLKDHSGAVLGAIGSGYTTKLGSRVVNQVWTVRVAPAKTGTAAPRTLEVAWTAPPDAPGGSNIEYQAVAMSSKHSSVAATTAAARQEAAVTVGNDSRSNSSAIQQFVMLQAARLEY